MKYLLFPFILGFISAIILACSDGPTDRKILSRINSYELTLDEFEEQLAAEPEIDPSFKLTDETKKYFLEELIRKELLIQEAKSRKLDQQKKFIRAIEKYWELTLIRDLIEQKSREISSKIYVSEEETIERYHNMKQENPELADFKAMESEIKAVLKEKKKSLLLQQWISGLREKATVKIYPSALFKGGNHASTETIPSAKNASD
jgi:hypothetical protein